MKRCYVIFVGKVYEDGEVLIVESESESQLKREKCSTQIYE
jgi:hypothetical protein